MTTNTIFYNIENFDSLIFSLLTRQKIIVVGVDKMSDKFYEFIHQITPEEVNNFLTYQSSAKSLNDNSIILGVEMDEDSMKLLDKSQGKYTVVFLPNNEIYGQFTSPFCKKIASLLKEEKLDDLKEELSFFYKKAIESNEITTPADYMAAHDMNKADSSLLLWIRALHYNKEMNTILSDKDW